MYSTQRGGMSSNWRMALTPMSRSSVISRFSTAWTKSSVWFHSE
jgi:hypothetical protein